MLSVDIHEIEDGNRVRIAHVQITRNGGTNDDYNYLWRIQAPDASIAEGELNNFERSRSKLELLWQVLSLWTIGRENQQMVDEWLQGLIEISVENPGEAE